MIDNSFIETIEIFDDSDSDKSCTCNKRKNCQFRPIDKRDRQLYSGNKIGEQPDFVG